MHPDGLRLMVFDETCGHHRVRVPGTRKRANLPLGLSHAWRVGSWLYRGLRRLDAVRGVRSWAEALTWIGDYRPGQPLAEVQFWGHGKWGRALVDGESLEIGSLDQSHAHAPLLRRIQARIAGPDALWWWRTCETYGAERGHAFAQAFSDFLGCRTAGHTYVIGPWQSGLHTLRPGERPDWSPAEGLKRGTPKDPVSAYMSARTAPNTIHCLRNEIPPDW